MNSDAGAGDCLELARREEKISKARAAQLFEQGLLKNFETGTFKGLAQIHAHLFGEIFDFAGKVRDVNIAKGCFRFVPVMYLDEALKSVSQMPQSNFNEIVEKYVEMNVAHPFREGNGRSARIWLDAMLKKEIQRVIDWSRINKDDYLAAMERSPIKDTEIKLLLKNALTDKIHDRAVYMKGLDASYHYEGYSVYRAENLSGDSL